MLIEDCAPGELEALELDYERLAEQNPLLVVTSITPFGKTGPYRDYRAHHLNLYHASGQTSFGYTSDRSDKRPPPVGGGYVGEYDAGLTAAVGTMAAIVGRRGTGRGEQVEVSKLEAMMCVERVDIGRLSNDPDLPRWRGAVGGMMKAKDGYLMITAVQNHQWEGVVRAMGNPEWARDPQLSQAEGRRQQHDAVDAHIEAWLQRLSRDRAVERLLAAGIPAAAAINPHHLSPNAQLEHREFFHTLVHPVTGETRYPGLPMVFSAFGTRLHQSPPPTLGQHSREILCGELGLTDEQVARLEELSYNAKSKLIDLNSSLEKARLEMEKEMESGNDNLSAMKKNIESMSKIKVDIKELKLENWIDAKNVLTEEQKAQVKNRHPRFGSNI